jgi:hypothetical protein
MAGPVPTYLSTQLAAQTAFSVPFGLLSLVNAAIVTATAAGEFNTTVDCSLFTAEDVSNLRIYLDSLGYLVEFAKSTNERSLLIDWSKFLDIPGGEVVVDQGTSPWIVAGTVTVVQPTGTNLHTTVDNFPATQPISGAVTEVNVDKNFGAWSYYAGAFGTVIVGAGQRVLGIGVHATTTGVLTINGGASIPIPAGVSINIEPLANLVAPTIVFTGTDSYMVEVVS